MTLYEIAQKKLRLDIDCLKCEQCPKTYIIERRIKDTKENREKYGSKLDHNFNSALNCFECSHLHNTLTSKQEEKLIELIRSIHNDEHWQDYEIENFIKEGEKR
jgi:hypothetical protein